jgi:hypothetical protein
LSRITPYTGARRRGLFIFNREGFARLITNESNSTLWYRRLVVTGGIFKEKTNVETKISFEEWKKQATEYLHQKFHSDKYDWILGGDEDMKRDGYDNDESPSEYVDYQIECSQ